MKHSSLPSRILTFGFLIVIFLFGGMTLILRGDDIAHTAKSAYQMSASEGNGPFVSIKNSITAMETEYNMVFFSKSSFLVGNQLVRKVLGHSLFPGSTDDLDMVRLEDGSISNLKFSMNVNSCRQQLIQFKSYLDEMDIPLIFMYVPTKVLDPDSQLTFGTLDFSNRHADSFLQMLNEIGIDAIDTRPILLSTGRSTGELFFHTDTHWTIPSAFASYQALAQKLNQSYGFHIDSKYYDPANFETTLYENAFLGSFGYQTTPYYTGLDDFETVTPAFETSFTERTQRNDNIWTVREGSFQEAVMISSLLEPDEGKAYSSHCYQAYNYNWGEILFENHDPQADDKKVLIIKNSAGNPITAFTALGVQNVCGLDRRNLTRTTVAEYIADYQPDVAIIIYNYDFLRPDRLNFFVAPETAENLTQED